MEPKSSLALQLLHVDLDSIQQSFAPLDASTNLGIDQGSELNNEPEARNDHSIVEQKPESLHRYGVLCQSGLKCQFTHVCWLTIWSIGLLVAPHRLRALHHTAPVSERVPQRLLNTVIAED